MKHIGTVPLETERLILRRFTMEDDAAMFAHWANDPDVTRYLMWKPHDNIELTQQILAEWVASYEKLDYYQWGIEIKETGTLIGSIAAVIVKDDIEMVHIGYCIGKAWWRKGYTSEALTRLVQFYFEDVGLNRVESRHDPRNPNSGRVMKKAGLRYEGTMKEADWNNQGRCDAAYYAILAKDYFGLDEAMRDCLQ